jgi:HPt (histidine-containing phosphotransfer) domain-containing protein
MTDEPIRSEFADDPDMQELLQQFLEGLTEYCAQIQQGLDDEDLETLKRAGHQLKGAGGGYGYPAITISGGHLEHAVLQAGSLTDEVRDAANALIQVCRNAQRGQ